LYTVSKNVPPLTCYLYVVRLQQFLARNVAEKVGNQNELYFPTSPNSCFCTTWGNRKRRNCVFSLKCCMLFDQKARKTVTELNHPSLSKRSSGCTRQDLGREHSILLSVTHMLCVSQVCHGVSRCVNMGVVLHQASSESQWTVLMRYLAISNNFRRYHTHHRRQPFLSGRQCTGALCV